MKGGWCAVLVLGALAMITHGAAAGAWCDQTLIALAPTSVPAGRDTTFTVQVHNIGSSTITLTAVQIQFPWEGTYRDAGAGAIGPGQTSFFTTTVSPPQATQGLAAVRIAGTSSADSRDTAAASCDTTFAVTATASSPGLDAPAVVLGGAVIAAIASRRRR